MFLENFLMYFCLENFHINKCFFRNTFTIYFNEVSIYCFLIVLKSVEHFHVERAYSFYSIFCGVGWGIWTFLRRNILFYLNIKICNIGNVNIHIYIYIYLSSFNETSWKKYNINKLFSLIFTELERKILIVKMRDK